MVSTVRDAQESLSKYLERGHIPAMVEHSTHPTQLIVTVNTIAEIYQIPEEWYGITVIARTSQKVK